MQRMYPVIMLLICVAVIASVWRVFTKAGKPGWAAIVPIYNVLVMFEIAGMPAWNIILLFIPIANLYAAFKMSVGIAKAFGQGTGFGLGLMFLGFVFWPVLGFGNAQYQGGHAPSVPQQRRAA
jgi:hypothetical protein